MKREADRLNIKASLALLLLRDGTIYFVALRTLNIEHIVVVFSTRNVVYVTIFLIPIPSLLTSRFLLKLRHANETTNDIRLAYKSSLDSAFLSSYHAKRESFMDMDGAVWTEYASYEFRDPVEGEVEGAGAGRRGAP
ncbi:hypothetical protein FOMPIDRAFT_93766 [Fomitopsis schrenkii]|uniref:Uncharacterized protein n=1 Tax=Fomitopsis schrenkii TaxID=2126942 RepID=S8EXZ1_FOMSC|nr:hypothetical protein FOMPIDRAFT_93766 [Fomitopsis schrenkii]